MKKLTVAALVSVLSAGAIAHDGMHGPGSDYDYNEDESLLVAEYTAYLKEAKQDTSKAAALFAALDSNKDGKLSSAEFARGLPAKSK